MLFNTHSLPEKLIVYDIQNYRLQPVNLSVGKIKIPTYILLIIFFCNFALI